MTKIICIKCKNALLGDEEGKLICPSCGADFAKEDENLLLGIQFYNEGNLDTAKDFLMKYIVKNGAEPRAIIYKAICDGFDFDEDTVSLKETYEKITDALKEIPEELFPCYLKVVNDEIEKIEKALAEKHICLFEEADAEKIKKEVTSIISIQNEAKEFRSVLKQFADEFNEKATAVQITFNPSKSFLVEPEIATQVGNLKYNKILENIASHTVFTGILSTDIKNLEIYYRCIVMFFERNRQKYDFLMASAEKFAELSKVLEEGQYNTIKGTSTIGDKLKSAAYDFFQESLKDHDTDLDLVPETVEIIDIQPIETEPEIVEEPEMEDISSTSVDNVSEENIDEETNAIDLIEDTEIINEEAETSNVVEETEDTVKETEVVADAEEQEDTEATQVIDIEQPTEPEESEEESQNETETVEVVSNKKTVEELFESTEKKSEIDAKSVANGETIVIDVSPEIKAEVIPEENITEPQEEIETPKEKPQRKKSYAPIVTGLVIILGILAIIGFSVIPDKINESKYAKAVSLSKEKNYAEAAEVFAELGNYEDAEEKALKCKYDYAASLEEKKEYAIARDVYESLGDFQDSKAKANSCTYNIGLIKLDEKEYDKAIEQFETIKDYADSQSRIEECKYSKALLLIDAEHYEDAIDILSSLKANVDINNAINDAKYRYAKANLDKENSKTIEFLNDLVKAKYKDSVDVRNKLLGIEEEVKKGVEHCINYSEKDNKKNLKQADNKKPIYFHVTLNEKKYFDKKLTIQFETSMGYKETKNIVLTEKKNTYALYYPSTGSEDYTVTFKLIGNDKATLASQKITIE